MSDLAELVAPDMAALVPQMAPEILHGVIQTMERHMKKTITVSAVIASVSVLCLTQSLSCARPKVQELRLLFAQTAMDGRFENGVLTLNHLSRTTLCFSDRPTRAAGHLVTSDFFKLWNEGNDSFKKVPPNGVVSVIEGGKVHDAIVELSEPSLSGDAVSYQVKVLEGTLPPRFGSASVFIDAFPTSVNSQITDSITQGNVEGPGDAPADAVASLYQATAQALANAAHNATTSQQQTNVTAQAATTQGVAQLYSLDTASTGRMTQKLLMGK